MLIDSLLILSSRNLNLRLLKTMGKVQIVEKSRIFQLQVDIENGRITSENKEWILSQPLFFQALNDGIEKSFGSGARIICMVAGKNAGRRIVEANNKEIGSDRRNVLTILEKLFTWMGWGKIQLEDYSEKSQKAIIRIKNSAMARGIRNSSQKCHLIAGCLAGVFTKIFGVETSCIETNCAAKGDPYCRFIVKGVKS